MERTSKTKIEEILKDKVDKLKNVNDLTMEEYNFLALNEIIDVLCCITSDIQNQK